MPVDLFKLGQSDRGLHAGQPVIVAEYGKPIPPGEILALAFRLPDFQPVYFLIVLPIPYIGFLDFTFFLTINGCLGF